MNDNLRIARVIWSLAQYGAEASPEERIVELLIDLRAYAISEGMSIDQLMKQARLEAAESDGYF